MLALLQASGFFSLLNVGLLCPEVIPLQRNALGILRLLQHRNGVQEYWAVPCLEASALKLLFGNLES